MNRIMSKALRSFCELKLGKAISLSLVDESFEDEKCVSGLVKIDYFNNEGLRETLTMYVPRAILEEVTIL